eukprot:535862_1
MPLDWNRQHIIFLTLATTHHYSPLHTDIIQIICRIAYDVTLTSWQNHADQIDFVVMQNNIIQADQEHVNLHHSNYISTTQEFYFDIIHESEKRYFGPMYTMWLKQQWESENNQYHFQPSI